jgi:hypothetical protein
LINAPKTVLISWEDELRREKLSFINFSEETNADRASWFENTWETDFYLVNYEALINKGVEKAITTNPPDACVLDESTAIKSPRASVTQALLRLSDLFRIKACLSGYPAPESWSDIWTQMAFLNDGRWMGTSNFFKWIKGNATKDTYGHFFTVSQQKVIRDKYQSEAYCLSRRDAGLGETKIYQSRRGVLRNSDQKLYAEIARSWAIPGLSVSDQGSSDETVYAMVVAQWLRRLCGGHLPGRALDSWKYSELETILREHRSRRDAAIVWFCFTAEIERAFSELGRLDVFRGRCARIHGTTPLSERRRIVHEFQEGKIDFLFLQQKIGRFGLDLSRASTAVYFSNAYSSELRVQSEDRIVMPGKQDPLLYIDFVTAGTIEEDVIHDLRHKKVNARLLTSRVRSLRLSDLRNVAVD